MDNINCKINVINKNITKNIEILSDVNRGILAQNLLAQFRNLVEHVALKIYYETGFEPSNNGYIDIKESIKNLKIDTNTEFLWKFHNLLQKSVSHYTVNEDNSERLILKYYESLLRLRIFLKDYYSMDILAAIETLPLSTEPELKKYYEQIVEKIETKSSPNYPNNSSNRYYIQKKKPIFIDNKIYYEVTFTRASDNVSKFDRIVAYTHINILTNYSVNLSLIKDSINVLEVNMPILIITDWKVSIRPCEITNFLKIFNIYTTIASNTQEFISLNNYLTKNKIPLSSIIEFPEKNYLEFINYITKDVKYVHIASVFDLCRNIVKNNHAGKNIITYLLFTLNNKILKNQYSANSCHKISNLNLKYGCIPFDEMPFNTSLVSHNPKIYSLLECLSTESRSHELLARHIKSNTENFGKIYTKIEKSNYDEDIDELISEYNANLYYKHNQRQLLKYKGYVYVKEYEDDAIEIIKNLKIFTCSGVENYNNSIDSWLNEYPTVIDSSEKKEKIKVMFAHSKVSFIYGSAGTGKTTMINILSTFFNTKSKLYLANTHPAVDNLKRRVNASNSTFKTVKGYLMTNDSISYDILFIDECSTVSNKDILDIIKKNNFVLLVLVGDIFQIEAITFGNWFGLCRRNFMPKNSIIELGDPYRTKNENLLEFWKSVRNKNDDILEHIIKNSFSSKLDNSIFRKTAYDEIILCLNYDGLYGINNINNFLQNNNKNDAVIWGMKTYKIGDPILFNESNRFSPLIYNNLKGEIIDINIHSNHIIFDIEIDKAINALDILGLDLEIVGNNSNKNTIIRFKVQDTHNSDYDIDEVDSIVPFQVAYAVSIHKSQGLEYDSVKVIITDEVDEMITHNIFYTSVTRTRDKLKIYWSPETEKKIIHGFNNKENHLDRSLLKRLV